WRPFMNIVPLAMMAGMTPCNVLTDPMTTSTGGEPGEPTAFGCVIIAMHDPQTHSGAVAHISPGTANGPAVAQMAQFLLNQGGNAANFEVLLAGGANFAALRHLDLTNALAAAGIALANVFDRRVNDNLKVPIGPHNGPHWRQIVFDPATGNIAEQPLNPMPPGMPAGLTEYSLTAITGVPVPLP